jgi:hypothetical protein
MRHGNRSHEPTEAPALELQPADVRRRDSERVKAAEQIVRKARLDQLSRAHRSARLGRLLQHEHVPAPIGEKVRRHEPVVARADNDRGDHAHAASEPWRLGSTRLGRGAVPSASAFKRLSRSIKKSFPCL